MPLTKSPSKEVFSQNVAEMRDAGHPRAQALAAAYRVMREAKKRRKGGRLQRADGGEALSDADQAAMMPETYANPAVDHLIRNTAAIPKRAIEAAANYQPGQPETYDPAPIVDAAMLPMGTGAIAGVPMRAGEAVLGAGAIRKLPMDEVSRLARAKEQGYTIDAYHGTNSDFPAFDRIDEGNARGAGIYVTTSPESASRYATGDVNRITPSGNAHPNVLPLKVRTRQPFDENSILTKEQINEIEKAAISAGHNWKKGELAKTFDRAYPPKGYNVLQTLSYNPDEQNKVLRAVGYDSRIGGGIGDPAKDIVVFDPSNVRSRFAKFDPEKLDSANLGHANGGTVRNPAVTRALAVARRAKGGKVHIGPIKGNDGGRTDVHQMAVPDGAYVLPADFISHLGESNSQAGLKKAQEHFGDAPKRNAGGAVKPVDCITAAGEFVISPAKVKEIGKGDLEFGHKVLDRLVMSMRKDHIHTLAGLPEPAQD